MSYHASTWAAEFSEARLASRLVMFAIAHRVSSDEEGEAHPSLETLAKETRLDKSTVIESIKKLTDLGELIVKKGGRFPGNSNSYSLPKFAIWLRGIQDGKGVGIPNPKPRSRGGVRVGNGPDYGLEVAPTRIINTYDESNTSSQPALLAIPQKQKEVIPLPEIPEWMPVDLWNGFMEVRRKKKAVPTALAYRLLIDDLTIWRFQGHDISAILRTAITRNWTGLFLPNENGNGKIKSVSRPPADAYEETMKGRNR